MIPGTVAGADAMAGRGEQTGHVWWWRAVRERRIDAKVFDRTKSRVLNLIFNKYIKKLVRYYFVRAKSKEVEHHDDMIHESSTTKSSRRTYSEFHRLLYWRKLEAPKSPHLHKSGAGCGWMFAAVYNRKAGFLRPEE